jgi:type VI secretion system protein ImpK
MAMASKEAKARIPPAALQPPEPEVEARQTRLMDRLTQAVGEEIGLRMVQVMEGPVVRVMEGFPSGSDQVRNNYRPMLEKVVRALQGEGSYIEVIGHTDNRPIFNARFPSNWELSNARAENIADILQSYGIPEDRITHTGRSDQDPIAGNDTPEERALNRRVDIHIR